MGRTCDVQTAVIWKLIDTESADSGTTNFASLEPFLEVTQETLEEEKLVQMVKEQWSNFTTPLHDHSANAVHIPKG